MAKINIEMPQLGEAIAEATVAKIFIKNGDIIKTDEVIMEVETSKAVMEITANYSGTVTEINAKEGMLYNVGSILGCIEVDEKDLPKKANPIKDSNQNNEIEIEQPLKESKPHFDTPDIDKDKSIPVPFLTTGAAYMTPRMKSRMIELGLNNADLAAIPGSGKGGRITVEDFEKFLQHLEQFKVSKASSMRIAVADSMRRSWTRPLATVGSPVNLDKLLAHRKTFKDIKPGPALYALRALSIALSENLAVAGRLIGSKIVHSYNIDIGFAVEVEDGVMVPVLSDVNKKSLKSLISPYNDLINQAKKGKLPREASKRGIATVTNYGTFGIVWATPIPLPEQNLVLGLGMGRKKPIWDKEQNTFIPTVEAQMTLSFDHRILDGGGAGRLLKRISDLINKPQFL